MSFELFLDLKKKKKKAAANRIDCVRLVCDMTQVIQFTVQQVREHDVCKGLVSASHLSNDHNIGFFKLIREASIFTVHEVTIIQ